MKTLTKITFTILLASLAAFAQTATPNTTLCATQTATAGTVCLTATTGVVNQTGVYVDQEYELVNLANSQVACTGPCYVPVSRNNRAAGSGPTAHANAAVAWLAYTPGQSIIVGNNGFHLGTNITDVGACTRTAQVYLPHIYVNRGIKRDCTTTGVWVDYAPASGLDFPSPTPLTTIAADSALSVSSGNYALITKAGTIALTLTAPTAGLMDGMVITIKAYNGAYADTLTATSLLETGATGSPYTTATFGATSSFVGSSLTLVAYAGKWYVLTSTGVAFT